jgi:RNase P/RNase MRP subunit p29
MAEKQSITQFAKVLVFRDIRNVRKRQHQYPEFGHTQGEIQKKTAKKYISIQGWVWGETKKTINFDGS